MSLEKKAVIKSFFFFFKLCLHTIAFPLLISDSCFPGGATVENLPANAGDEGDAGVQSLGWEDHLEKKMATHFSILAREITWTEKPGKLQSMGSQKSQTQQRYRLVYPILKETNKQTKKVILP